MNGFVIALKDLIMQNLHKVPPTAKLPSLQTRRAACTHMSLTRLYGNHKCSHCHRIPRLGWVYRCTQDHGGKLAEFQAIDLGSSDSTSGKEFEEGSKIGTVQLSPWIEDAIKDGHYTPNQIILLRAQKQKVKDCIAAVEKEFMQKNNTRSNKFPTPSLPAAINSDPNLPFPVIGKVHNAMSILDHPDLDKSSGLEPSFSDETRVIGPRVFPECGYMGCQTCRPTYKDRSWQCLYHILIDQETGSFPDFDSDNRPISDVDLVRQLALLKPPPRPSPFDDFSLISSDVDSRVEFNRHAGSRNGDFEGTYGMGEYKLETAGIGFRESVKRALRGARVGHDQRLTDSKSYNRSSRRTRSTQESKQSVEELSAECQKKLLVEASNVKLPGHDGMDGLDHDPGEVEVENGVAVTEEAVDLASADIIMAM